MYTNTYVHTHTYIFFKYVYIENKCSKRECLRARIAYTHSLSNIYTHTVQLYTRIFLLTIHA